MKIQGWLIFSTTMKVFFIVFVLSLGEMVIAQGYQTFNLTPDIGAYNQNSQFFSVMVDSQIIYILGDELIEKSPGQVKIENHYTRFNYSGNLLTRNIFQDSTLPGLYIAAIVPPIKMNDSIYLCYNYTVNDAARNYSDPTLIKFDVKNKKILHKITFRHPLNLDQPFDSRAISYDPLSKEIVMGFQTIINDYPFIYIYELDSTYAVTKSIILPKFSWYTFADAIQKQSDGTYDLVCDSHEYKNKNPTGLVKLTFIKVDSAGNILKIKDLNTSHNIAIVSGETFTIYRNIDKTYNISAHEYNETLNRTAPWAMHISAEFDTLYWIKKFYEYPDLNSDQPDYSINHMIYFPLDSSFITVGNILDYNGQGGSYGLIYKVNTKGDSIWTRKYIPTGWEKGRAFWMDLYQIQPTSFNTIVVCGRVSDTLDRSIKGWLLHLDKDGCLVPGCSEFVKNEDIQSGKEKAFKLYPNPVLGKFYLLSRISLNEELRFSIINLQGQKLKDTKIKPEVGVQYIFRIPDDLLSGNYILNISDQKGRLIQAEKLIIQN